jgi:small subunit ribosomal protein S4
MSRYTGPKLKIIRKLGNLAGFTQKSLKQVNNLNKYENSEKNITEYRLRLEEKQKIKFNYGLTENQLYNYVKEARRQKGITGLILLQLLGMRLDNICFSLGLAPTISGARQLVNHGHIYVNSKPVSIANFQCRPNDLISISKNLKSQNLIKLNLKNQKILRRFSNLKFDNLKLEGLVENFCERSDILLELNELKIIEYYSRQ